ncbi:hypothetical protein ACFQE7_39245 [Nonomuraea ferruginea]
MEAAIERTCSLTGARPIMASSSASASSTEICGRPWAFSGCASGLPSRARTRTRSSAPSSALARRASRKR